jgi:broad specificity phosphatase PhoE
MTKIILIRHGETDWNRDQVFRGRIDVALNEVGLTQARALQGSLHDSEIDGMYSSPLSRAFETASILGEKRNVDVNTEEGLIDVDFGKWQGLSHQKVKEEYNDLYETWRTQPHAVTFPEGETLKEVRRRSMEALEKVIKDNPGKTLALVSHRVVLKVVLCAIMGLELSHFWYLRQDTCALNRFEYRDGNYFLTLLNDTCHLRAVQGASQVDF